MKVKVHQSAAGRTTALLTHINLSFVKFTHSQIWKEKNFFTLTDVKMSLLQGQYNTSEEFGSKAL
jgi:hypothetical protein